MPQESANCQLQEQAISNGCNSRKIFSTFSLYMSKEFHSKEKVVGNVTLLKSPKYGGERGSLGVS